MFMLVRYLKCDFIKNLKKSFPSIFPVYFILFSVSTQFFTKIKKFSLNKKKNNLYKKVMPCYETILLS